VTQVHAIVEVEDMYSIVYTDSITNDSLGFLILFPKYSGEFPVIRIWTSGKIQEEYGRNLTKGCLSLLVVDPSFLAPVHVSIAVMFSAWAVANAVRTALWSHLTKPKQNIILKTKTSFNM